MLSGFVNLALMLMAAGALGHSVKLGSLKGTFKYFTSLSNLWCGTAALVLAVCRFAGSAPRIVLLMKYSGTAAVTLTILTVLIYLTPAVGSLKPLIKSHDLFLHLICPLTALISYCALDRVSAPFVTVLWGYVPVMLYGCLYLYKAVFAPESKRWKDFYGFNRGGKWPWTFAALNAAGFIISLALWGIGRIA